MSFFSAGWDSNSSSSEDEGKSREEKVIFEDEFLSGLFILMDRVFDGTVKKVRLNYWPEMANYKKKNTDP